MTISRSTQNQLSKGDFDAIENDWLTHLEKDPAELDYFVGVARALVGNGEEKRAKALLEMLDEQLRDSNQAARLKLLRRIGEILLPPEKLHSAIVSSLTKAHGDKSTFKGLSEAVGLHKAPQEIAKTWEKVEKLENLLAFDVGTVVAMEGKGVGRVVDANLGLESFKVDFERIKGMTVGFKAAAKLLRPLAPEHVLRRKLEHPAELKREKPTELLRIILQSYDRPLTASEIKDIMVGLITESQWTSWWGAARKHPQVVASGGSRQTYAWADTSGDAMDSLWKAYTRADPRKKIERLRRDGPRDKTLRDRMAEDLAQIAEESMDADPGLAFEIWFALERTGGAPEGVDWQPEVLLMEKDLGRLFSNIEERLLRERAYTMVRERREDWTSVYRDAMTRETDPRALEILADGLREGAPRELERFLDTLLSQPHRYAAAFLWMAERAAVDESFRAKNPLRLLQQILGSASRDEFATFRLRLLALAESGGTLPRLLTHLSEEQAAQAEDAVRRAAAFEPYQRDSLVSALELRFQSLRKEAEVAPLYALNASIDVKREELHQILAVDIPANRKAIEEARAMGDLRENFEYKSARQRHEYLNARAAALNGELSRVRPIELLSGEPEEVRIGTRVRLSGPTGRLVTLLGPWESRPEDNVISYESDLGKEILGKRVGDEVLVGGKPTQIAAIEVYTP